MSDLPLDTILHGDCLDVLRSLPDASVDALVTDPPYGLGAAPDMLDVLRAWLAGEVYTARGAGFMGKAWDAFVPGPEYWRECLRVLKPGGHALVFAGTRTWDVMGLALRLAGFELRDTLQWLYGSGFPKSLDVGKQLDKMAGATRQKVGSYKGATNIGKGSSNSYIVGNTRTPRTTVDITAPATDAARQWDGYGTALKPAWEPVILCRKPLAEPTIAANVLRYGTGALNIGASRVAHDGEKITPNVRDTRQAGDGWTRPWMEDRAKDERRQVAAYERMQQAGRWPANLLLSHTDSCDETRGCSLWCPVRELDRQSGVLKSGGYPPSGAMRSQVATYGKPTARGEQRFTSSEGGASRYFATFRYQAKASRAERNRGCEGLPMRSAGEVTGGRKEGSAGLNSPRAGAGRTSGNQNTHPTVKSLQLMLWLITLITPPGGVVLDPFAGSGSTCVAAKAGGWRYIGIEREAEYVAICEARLTATQEPSLGSAVAMEQPKPVQPAKKPRKRAPAKPAADLWESAV